MRLAECAAAVMEERCFRKVNGEVQPALFWSALCCVRTATGGSRYHQSPSQEKHL